LERAREAAGLPVKVTAHLAKHSYCTNWIGQYGDGERAMEKLSRQVGTSPAVLRDTYVHIVVDDDEWGQIQNFGALGA